MKSHGYHNISLPIIQRAAFSADERKTNFFSRSNSTQSNSASFIQPKLTVNEPNDKFEKEADAVANDVVNRNGGTNRLQTKQISGIQRKCKECEEEEGMVQEKPEGSSTNVAPTLSNSIESSSGKGNSLPTKTLTEMNSSFGTDFSGVHIHNDSGSASMNKELNAQAFTHGNDIYFNAGKYNPESTTGRQLLAHELTHVIQQGRAPSVISRKISVENPDNNIPNPGGAGLVQTNVVTVLDYMSKLCPDTGMMTNGGSIDLVDTGFCFPSVKQKDGTFKSPSALSAHPVSCECICEMIMDPLQNIVIRIDDTRNGNAGTSSTPGGATISVPSPNMKVPDVRGASGKNISTPHFIVLGHELCGHHFLEKRGSDERENTQNIPRGGHDPAIKRENLMREEHGLEKRGTFRDPCCGMLESTDEDLKKTSGKCGDIFEKQKDEKGTVANECKHWREEYNKLNGTSFTTDDAIPDKPLETLPATWRIEVFFKKDMPQAWNTLEQSLTADGKEALEVVKILLTKHPEFKAQLAGNASSDKPASDPTYNKRLAKLRAEFILKDLLKKGFERTRIVTFDSDCEKLSEGVHNCSDSESQKKSNELDRNVEVKLF
jgi:hypothetical protein